MFDELVKRLREDKSWVEQGTTETEHEISEHIQQAADAIEELIRKEKFHAFLWNTIQPNEMEQYVSMYNSGNIPQKPPKEESYGV